MEERHESWADKNDDEVGVALSNVVTRILGEQGERNAERMVLDALYDGSLLRTMTGQNELAGVDAVPPNMLSINVVKTMVDACTARVAARNPPKAVFSTLGATWSDQMRAKRMSQGLEGAMVDQKGPTKHVRAFRTACIFGDGEILTERWDDRVRIVRALPGEFFVDERECVRDEPRRLYRKTLVDKAVLASAFPKSRKKILMMNRDTFATDELMWGLDRNTDGLVVVEAWSLRSSRKAKDGRYVCIVGEELLEELEYERDRFPVSRMSWCPPEVGWYGTSLAKELMPIQLEINDLMDRINDAQKVVAGKWFVEQQSRVNTSHLTDERDGIVMYRGTQPVYVTPNAIPPQMYEHLWNLWQKAFEVTGISQLSASSMKPAGLNSGVALRAYRDGESERFATKAADYEAMVLDTARNVVYELNALAEDDPELTVRYVGKEGARAIVWAETKLEEASYDLQIQAVSGMPNTPAARLEFVEQLAKMQVFEPRALAKMLGSGIPDIESIVMEANAAEELTRGIITAIVEDGEFSAPEPEMQLDIALTVAQQMYLDFRRRGASVDDLTEVARWIALAAKMIEAKQPPPPPPPMPGAGGPEGGPPPPPEGGM
jgi:hypothetical protein